MLSSHDTLRVQLAQFVTTAWSMALEFTVLGQPDLAWLLRSFQQDFVNYLAILF